MLFSMKTFPERLKMARVMRNISQKKLAAEIGTTQTAIARYESGGLKHPKTERIQALAIALHVSPCWLLFGEG